MSLEKSDVYEACVFSDKPEVTLQYFNLEIKDFKQLYDFS